MAKDTPVASEANSKIVFSRKGGAASLIASRAGYLTCGSGDAASRMYGRKAVLRSSGFAGPISKASCWSKSSPGTGSPSWNLDGGGGEG